MESTDAVVSDSLYRKPFAWLCMAWALVLIPAIGFILDSQSLAKEIHPALNALLNASSAFFLIAGRIAISQQKRDLHRLCMIAATTASGVFLVSYLIRFATTGAHKYPGIGWDKTLYLSILLSHMVLALVLVPLALRSLYLGLKGRYASHKKQAQWAWPIWMYVSVTGVIVYLMLYPIANFLYRT